MTLRLYDARSGAWVAEGDGAIAAAADWVAEGGVLAHPTSTVYGLGGRPDPETDAEIARLKKRPAERPLIRLGASAEEIERALPDAVWPGAARTLAAEFWPGPLTLILPTRDESGVAVRVDPQPVLKAVLERLGGLMTSTSLNLSGEPPATGGRQALGALGSLGEAGRAVALLDVGDLPEARPSTIVRVGQDRVDLVRAGDIAWDAITACLERVADSPAERVRLLFVCTGNTCRSPAAAVLAAAEARRRGADHVEVASAGTFALPGQLAAGPSMFVARERGLDLEGHRSRELDLELAEWATHIIGMTPSHAHAAEQLVPGLRVSLLNDFLPPEHPAHGTGVADPFGGDVETYERTYRELEVAVSALFDTLLGSTDGT